MDLSDAEIEEISGAVVALANSEVKKGLEEIRADLDKKWAEGVSPADEKVKDLEKQLDQKNGELEKLMDGHKDELRLLRGELGELGAGFTRPEGGPRDPMRFDFKNGFVGDHDALKRVVYASAGDDFRVEKHISTGDFSTDLNVATVNAKLPPEVSDRFIDLIVQEQSLLSRITLRRMLSPEAKLDELRITARRLRRADMSALTFANGGNVVNRFGGAQEGTAPAETSQSMTFPARVLRTVEVIWTEDITLSFLEDNIERANAEAHIASAIARQFGTDLNDLAWNGVQDNDALAADTNDAWFLSIADGFLQLLGADAAVVDVDISTTGSARELLSTMHNGVPQRFKARADYAYWVPTGVAEKYAEEVSVRESDLGDGVLINGFPALRYFGRPVIPEPHLSANVALAPTTNLVYGIHRNIRVDSEFKPRQRLFEWTVTARIGYQYASGIVNVLSTGAIPAAATS